MASWTQRLLLALTILIGILSVSAFARPCKTLFISSYSIHFNPQTPNPNSDNPTGFVTIFTEIRQFSPHRPLIFLDRPILPSIDHQDQHHLIHEPKRRVLPFDYDFSSLRDRTKDILSVVVALLFGVGCGSLTAVTMYLVWSLFANRHDSHNSYEEFSDGEDNDDLSPKKIGYEKIPAKEAA